MVDDSAGIASDDSPEELGLKTLKGYRNHIYIEE